MTNTFKAIPLEAWKPNQKVVLEPVKGHIRVTADQARSTPGVVTEIPVEPGENYSLELEAVSNFTVQIFLLEDGKKKQPPWRVSLPQSLETVSFQFRGPKSGIAQIGVLFSSSSVASSSHPRDCSFEILSAGIKHVPRRSGIVASMATMPSRADKLPATITSIIGQVDHLYVHLNGFKNIPDILENPQITVSRSQDFGDLKDTGKFLNLEGVDDDAYVFTIDDDIVYPADYVSRMLACLKRFDDKVVAGVHGITYPWRTNGFFDRLVLHFKRELPIDVPVSCLGTGTTAFKMGTLRPDISDFTRHGMADLFFAGLAKRSRVPLICIKRPKGWLFEVGSADGSEDSLYQETRKDDGPHSEVLSEFGPWGYDTISDAIVQQWGSKKAAPLNPSARQFLEFMSWIQSGSTGRRPEVTPTPEMIQLASLLNMPVLLREMIYG